ncbi:MAG TPA: hypothetical protein VFV78_00495 [Vicinamibacterales bacterium]|nr:hypothetical protein [Vicinamibacterales bacterium]
MTIVRTARAGSAIEDYCRACKVDRMHTVIAADAAGHPLRVQCGYCRSEHNYRGGPRTATNDSPATEASPAAATPARSATSSDAFPIVSERERTSPVMSGDIASSSGDLEQLLRRVIREEAGVSPVVPAARWRGGMLVLRPGTPGLQEKSIPIETFFHKIVMLRNRLRTLEQQVNASDLPDDAKVKLQAYVSGCYGSLTTFNVLFADEADQFKGTGGE